MNSGDPPTHPMPQPLNNKEKTLKMMKNNNSAARETLIKDPVDDNITAEAVHLLSNNDTIDGADVEQEGHYHVLTHKPDLLRVAQGSSSIDDEVGDCNRGTRISYWQVTSSSTSSLKEVFNDIPGRVSESNARHCDGGEDVDGVGQRSNNTSRLLPDSQQHSAAEDCTGALKNSSVGFQKFQPKDRTG